MGYRPIFLCSYETIFGEIENAGQNHGSDLTDEKGNKKLRERERKGKGEEVEKVKRKKEYYYLKQQIISGGKEFGSC